MQSTTTTTSNSNEYERQIKVQGTTEEIADLEAKHGIRVIKEVEVLRSFMIQYFFHFHEDSDFGDQKDSAEAAFIFHCNSCDQHTQYYRRPLSNFSPELCLSTPCLRRKVEYQMELMSDAEKEIADLSNCAAQAEDDECEDVTLGNIPSNNQEEEEGKINDSQILDVDEDVIAADQQLIVPGDNNPSTEIDFDISHV